VELGDLEVQNKPVLKAGLRPMFAYGDSLSQSMA
jgi:hypothetical protein